MQFLVYLHIVLIFLVTFRLLTRDSLSPAARLSWLMITVFAPLLGVILYLLFGETRRGLRTDMRVKRLVRQYKGPNAKALGDISLLQDRVEDLYQPAFRYAQSINGFGPSIGNRAELLSAEPKTISRLIEDIDNAKIRVNVLTYIWLQDETGSAVAHALIRAAKRGVKCKAMADGLGSRQFLHSKLWLELQDAGVEVCIAQPFPNIIKTILFSRVDLRNHRKIVVIDGKITYCGSRNLADIDYSPKPKYAPWIDMVVRFEGDVAIQNQMLFASDWLLQKNEGIEDFFAGEPDVKQVNGEGILAQVWGDGPTEREQATPQMFTTLINCAKHSIMITTPYFVPGESVFSAMTAAALRGVEVVLIMPQRNDSWVVAAASRSYYSRLAAAGVHIYEFQGGLLHSKIITVDGKVSMFGSSNLDLRSFDLNYENNMLIYDEDLTREINDRQKEYLRSSVPVTPGEIANWPLHKRIWDNIIATMGPVL